MARGKKEIRQCKNCDEKFEALCVKIKQGGGIFCSSNCYHKFQKNNAQDPKLRAKKHRIKHLYNLTLDEYEDLLLRYENKCGICKKKISDENVCIDHCHNTGKVRGVLCSNCNTGIGMFEDNVSFLLNAIEYLKLKK